MTSRERAISNLKQMCSDGRYLGSGSYAPLEVLEDFKVAIKALEQESKTGKWKVIEVLHGEWEGTKRYACDKCGEKVGVFKSNYCPKCGAKMESEEV